MALEDDPQTLLKVIEVLASAFRQQKKKKLCFDCFPCHQSSIAYGTVFWHPCALNQSVLDDCRFQGTPYKDAGFPFPRWHRQMVIVVADFQPFVLEKLFVWLLKASWLGPVSPTFHPCCSHSTRGDSHVRLHPRPWEYPWTDLTLTESQYPVPGAVLPAHAPLLTGLTHYLGPYSILCPVISWFAFVVSSRIVGGQINYFVLLKSVYSCSEWPH